MEALSAFIIICIAGYVLGTSILWTLAACLPKTGIYPTDDHVLLECDSCREKPRSSGLCTACGHNRWVAEELDLPFGGMEELPLKRNQ